MFPVTRINEIEAASCPLRQILAKVTGKWQILILLALDDGPLRFNELKRTVGDITQRVLAENLKKLARDGFVVRTVHGESPVSVSYELSDLAREFITTLQPVIFWAQDSFQKVEDARVSYDSQV